MKSPKPCKRGNVADRDKWGHCLCADCKLFQSLRQKETRRPGYHAEWRSQNPEKVKEYTARWITENKAQRDAIVKSWRERNPDKVAAINSRSGKKWAANNKGVRMASVRNRQAAKLKRTPAWADKEKIKAIYMEAQRLTEETGIPHEVDHFYPLQGRFVSGLHVENNLQILTISENRKKGIKCES